MLMVLMREIGEIVLFFRETISILVTGKIYHMVKKSQ
jgi:hypothetical protein